MYQANPAPHEYVMTTVNEKDNNRATAINVYSTDDVACARSLILLAVQALDRASHQMTGAENLRLAKVARLALVDIKHTLDDVGL